MKQCAVSLFPLFVGVFGIILLWSVLAIVLIGYNDIKEHSPEPLGGKAIAIYQTYQNVDDALLYLDEAAKLSLNKAVYDVANDGFYDARVNSCSSTKGIGDPFWWSKGSTTDSICDAELTQCIPPNYDVFKDYFAAELESHIDSYNKEGKPKLVEDVSNNYDFKLSKSGKLEITGKTSEQINIKPIAKKHYTLYYKSNANFRESIDVNFDDNFKKLTAKALSLVGTGTTVLEEGNLQWDINVVERCGGECKMRIGEVCETDKCEFVKDDPDCDDSITKCSTSEVCEMGTWKIPYCDQTASISVRVIDDISVSGERIFKKIVTEDGSKDLTYRFALNWFEMGVDEVCTP